MDMRYRCVPIAVDDGDKPIYLPTEDELASIASGGFRCISCLEKRPRKLFGGYRAGRKLCRFCLPYVDDAEAVAMVAFDRKHGFGDIN